MSRIDRSVSHDQSVYLSRILVWMVYKAAVTVGGATVPSFRPLREAAADCGWCLTEALLMSLVR